MFLFLSFKAIQASAISAFFQYGPANRSPNWHYIWTPSVFCSCTTNLERITAWAETVQYNTSVFQVSSEDTLLLPSHGQFAPHIKLRLRLYFLWWSLRLLNKFMTDTDIMGPDSLSQSDRISLSSVLLALSRLGRNGNYSIIPQYHMHKYTQQAETAGIINITVPQSTFWATCPRQGIIANGNWVSVTNSH